MRLRKRRRAMQGKCKKTGAEAVAEVTPRRPAKKDRWKVECLEHQFQKPEA